MNNAGIAITAASITQMSLADFQKQQAVNVDGVFLGVKHALPLMREAGHGGSIINMSSVAGLKGSPTLAAYSATKGAVRMFTKAVALECAEAKDGVRVNSVHPGIIETPIWQAILRPRRGWAECSSRSRRVVDRCGAHGGQGRARGYRGRRAVAGERRVALRHRHGDGDRRRLLDPLRRLCDANLKKARSPSIFAAPGRVQSQSIPRPSNRAA